MSDRRLVPDAAAVDWGLLAGVVAAVATGLYGLVAGRPGQSWVIAAHGGAGAAVALLVALKLVRVRHRIRPANLTSARGLSVALAAVALAALATGIGWVVGLESPLGFWTLLTVHMWLGAAVALLVGAHLTYRRRPAASVARAGRRDALRYLGVAVAGALGWRLSQALGSARRFTGSRERGSGAGNRFPVTAWVADDPDSVDEQAWSLTVGGRVERALELEYGEVVGEPDGGPPTPATVRATLDCTSGWYSVHDWRGVRVGDLLAAAGVREDARWVQFRSVTGYRWSLPLDEARGALLATHVEDQPLSHGHGFPLRLVAPGRRGFQWVKWVTSVELRRRRDLGEWVAIHVSGFDGEA